MTKLSIIVPVHNTEEHICRCIESILHQTYKDIEIICIDDGSTDLSLYILKKYSELDTRLVVLNQPHKGTASALNLGIEKSNGEYIIFCASCDYLEAIACEAIINEFYKTSSDIVLFGYNSFNNDDVISSNVYKNKKCENINKSDINLFFNLPVYIWNNAFKKTFIKNYGLKFIEGANCSVDLIFLLSAILFNPKYGFCQKVLYNYFQNRNNEKPLNLIINNFKTLKYIVNTTEFHIAQKNVQTSIINYLLTQSVCHINNSLSDKEYDIIISEAENFINYLKNEFPELKCSSLKSFKSLKTAICQSRII